MSLWEHAVQTATGNFVHLCPKQPKQHDKNKEQKQAKFGLNKQHNLILIVSRFKRNFDFIIKISPLINVVVQFFFRIVPLRYVQVSVGSLSSLSSFHRCPNECSFDNKVVFDLMLVMWLLKLLAAAAAFDHANKILHRLRWKCSWSFSTFVFVWATETSYTRLFNKYGRL